MFLYLITNLVTGKQYVGITVDLAKRWATHKRGKGSKLVYAAIQKYGVENFKFESLYEGDEDLIKSLEIKVIGALDTMAPNGYNLTFGGEGTLGWNPSKETREKIGRAQKGKTLSPAHRKIISNTQKEKWSNPEERKRHSNKLKGVKKSPQHCKRIGDARRGKKLSLEACKNMGVAQKKRFETKEARREYSHKFARHVLVDGIKYLCLRDAAEAQGINLNTLRSWFYKWSKKNTWPDGFKYL